MNMNIIAKLVRVLRGIARRARVSWHQQRRIRVSHAVLGQLDDFTLRDLGLDRSDLMSVAAELAEAAEPTRRRTPLVPRVARLLGPRTRLVSTRQQHSAPTSH